jgi:hypothetical protein
VFRFKNYWTNFIIICHWFLQLHEDQKKFCQSFKKTFALSWSRIFFLRQNVHSVSQEIPRVSETLRFITALKVTHHLSPFWARLLHCTHNTHTIGKIRNVKYVSFSHMWTLGLI